MVGLDDGILSDQVPGQAVGWPLAMSADGAVIACRLTDLKTGRACVAVNGQRGEEFDAVGPPVLSRDGARLAYRAQEGNRSFVVIGSERGPACDLMSDPAISADGRVVAYAAERGGRWSLVVGARETPLDHQPSHVFLSDDGGSVGYWYFESRPGGASMIRVVAGSKTGEAFTLVGRPVFSPDGRKAAYAADSGGRPFIVIGDRAFEAAGRASDPVFSPDGTEVGYGVRIGREIRWKVLEVD